MEDQLKEPPGLEVVGEEEDEPSTPIVFDIATYPSDPTLKVIHDMYHSGDIYIPDYQRRFVWKIKQASKLIESFLIGLPVPQIFFYVDEDSRSQVIDGQQRILSMIYYIDGYFGDESSQGRKQVFRLTGLNDKSPYYNLKFDQLSEADQRKLLGRVLRAINIRQLKPKGDPQSVYQIFERLNTGGTALKAQEIRNCVYRGAMSGTLRTLNTLPDWRAIVGREVVDKHQKDVELILRVLAFTAYREKYDKPMKEFLNNTLEWVEENPSVPGNEFANSFTSACAFILKHLGPKPFHLRGPLNASALDSVMATVIRNPGKLKKDFKAAYSKLSADKRFLEATHVSTSDKSVISLKFNVVDEHLLAS